MRALTALQTASVSSLATEPQYLVYIELDQPYYLSSRMEAMYDGNLYQPGSLQIARVAHDAAELRIDNHDYTFTSGALDGTFMRGVVKVWWAYGTPLSGTGSYIAEDYFEEDYIEAFVTEQDVDPFLLFSGLIYGTPQINEWLSVTARRTPPRLYPYAKLRPPLANHLPSAGYVLQFDGAVLKIEAQL